MIQFVNGALCLSSGLAGLFFLRYWRLTRDRIFLAFSGAFWALACQWLLNEILAPPDETRHYLYLLRLMAFVLIIVGIVDKNRRSRPSNR